jgi:hypothetical protein
MGGGEVALKSFAVLRPGGRAAFIASGLTAPVFCDSFESEAVIPCCHSCHGDNDRQHHRAPIRRCRLSQPQCATRLQVQGVYVRPEAPARTPQIKRELRRRAAIEPVFGHLKAEHRMSRNYLAHHAGDAVNAVLAAAAYNFHLLLKWMELLLSRFLAPRKAIAALHRV